MTPDLELAIPSPYKNQKSVTEHFHRLNSVIPLDQHVLSIPPDMLAIDALRIMSENGFSQLPIVLGQEVLGLFSYRSFTKAVVSHSEQVTKNNRFDLLDLSVEECFENPKFARVTDEFKDWFEFINRNDAVLVGEPNRLQGIVTAMDILIYLYGVANRYVLIAEVELGLRALIRMAVNSETLKTCAEQCLKDKYKDQVPSSLEEMTFNDYVEIVGGRSWEHFQVVMGGNRLRTRAKLKQLGDLRNIVFHFKRDLTPEEYENLAALRDWMLIKARTAEARREGVTQ